MMGEKVDGHCACPFCDSQPVCDSLPKDIDVKKCRVEVRVCPTCKGPVNKDTGKCTACHPDPA
jgi:hypothetical protein